MMESDDFNPKKMIEKIRQNEQNLIKDEIEEENKNEIKEE